MGSGKAGGGEHGSAKREREREDGVLPLDHFQGDAQVAQDGHESIVMQVSGLSVIGDLRENTRSLDCTELP